MNARLYDPTIARFMSADSIIPFMYDTQAFNRYSYVKNNPLKYTDPSGHSWWTKATHWVKKNWKSIVKTIVTIAVVAIITFATGGFGGVALASSLGLAEGGIAASMVIGAVAGAGAGFVGGVLGSKLNGASWSSAFKTGLRGALVGAIGGAVAGGIGAGFGHDASFFKPGSKGMLNAGMKALSHGVSRAAIAKAQGQSATAAFWSGFAASGFSVGSNGYGGVAGRTTMMAVVSGTVSEATGGKFANGAVSGAFVHLFNAEGTRLVAYTKGNNVGLKEEKYTYTSNAERFGKVVDSMGVTRESFQAGLRNAGSIALAVGGGFVSGGTAWGVWGAGVALDGYSVYESGNILDASGSLAIPGTGKIGTGWAVWNAF